LGDVFEERSLKDMIIEAIRYGDLPETRAKLSQQVDHAFDRDHVNGLLDRSALAQETMSPERLFKVKEEMDKAEARRLQPYFVRAFFLKAFSTLGGTLHRREAERCEITHVPPALRDRDRVITGRNRKEQEPVLKRYDRVCFDRTSIQPNDKPGLARAVLLHPGHPLMLAMTDLILEQNTNLLRRGTVLVDPSDESDAPWLLFLLTHEVKSGDGQVLSKRMSFIRVNPDGSASFAGWAPHLDLEPLAAADRPRVADVLIAPWIKADLEHKAIGLAAATLVPEHFEEVATRRIAHVDKTLAAVHERLTKEIDYWSDREIKLKDDRAAGKDVRLNLDNVSKTLKDLQYRLESRKKTLQAMRQVQNGTPVVLGGALVVPAGLIRELRGERPGLTTADVLARQKIERLAMQAVIAAERAKGHHVVDVSSEKCGWDVTSLPPTVAGVIPPPRHIEVKGRAAGAETITVTRNEILYAVNQGEKFVLAMVFVNPDDSIDGPYYLTSPFQREPEWGVASSNYFVKDLLARAERPA
jgi:hypothetical protein